MPFSPQSSQTVNGSVGQGTGAGAARPWSAQLSDGAAYYTGAKTGQLPTTLGQTTKAASLSVALASDQVGTAGTAASNVISVQGIASMTPVQVSQATASNLNAAIVGTGTAGSAATGVVTVQGIASGTNLNVAQATASSLNAQVVGAGAAGSAVTGNPVRIGVSDGTNLRDLATDTSGRLKAAGASSFSYITTATTTAVKSSAGILRGVFVTSAFTVGSLTIYDAVGADTNPIAGFDPSVKQFWPFNVVCSNGIRVVTGAGFNGQVTIVYD